jgi:hypothetical protein
MGEMEANPIHGKIRELMGTPVETQEPVRGLPSQSATGYLSTPPASTGSMAQPETAATEPGAPPLNAPTPGPAAPAGVVRVENRPGPIIGSRPVSTPRQVLRTPDEVMEANMAARERGEIKGVVAAYEAVGVPHEEAVQRAIEERQRSRGMGAGAFQSLFGEAQDETGKWYPTTATFNRGTGNYETLDGKPLLNFRRSTTTGSVSLGSYYEQAARALGYPSGALAPTEARPAIEAKARELAGGQAGAVTSGRAQAEAVAPISTDARRAQTKIYTDQWAAATTSQREMSRQFSLMQVGMNRWQADPVGGSEAIIATFKKILDPSSVVRESEYARTGEGVNLLGRMEGLRDRWLGGGGAGVPESVLREMVTTARTMLTDENIRSGLDNIQKRIIANAALDNIDPTLIFGPDARAGLGAPSIPGQVGAPPPGTPPRATKDASGNWVIQLP